MPVQETGARRPECPTEKTFGLGFCLLPWQLSSVAREGTAGGEDLRQPGWRLPAGPLGCCIL